VVRSLARTPRINRFNRIRERLGSRLFNNLTFIDTSHAQPAGREYNFIDLFSGAGGNSLGLEWAGFKAVYAVETDSDACATYRENFPTTTLFEGPIQKVSKDMVESAVCGKKIHLICAGFPCQGFSIAGKRDPTDQRNMLYREVVRFVDYLKPWFVILENVPGILSMKKGRVVNSIRNDFAEIGYPGMSVYILESASFGVPQIRPRAVFVANRFGLPNPLPKQILRPADYIPIEAAISDLEKPADPTINHEWTRHSKDMERRLSLVVPGGSLYKTYVDAWKRQYRGVPAMTIKENHGGTHIHYELDRVLSAREMARLQSFPDSFIFQGRMKRVMWQVGNAAPPLLFKHIGLSLLPSLENVSQRSA
jgi:DNA (cytosine-5)-methyltransferase 1